MYLQLCTVAKMIQEYAGLVSLIEQINSCESGL